ncbi:zinc-binding metallopeptidase [Algibacter lectus]|uniref:zinc-binding metallopeptidase n=1 Tax=Algibacter lectus TaxID=221126 RepID=UPI0005A8544C|nr:putative zinc-binding metallopeptidase [Algibacter lectus]MDO7138012.1 putative zinc-binding metallopeptidase [Algibacter lectus]SFD42556.1 substrate import-associated zinc metallohydrolase lipoprotein [Algibacter lectus]
MKKINFLILLIFSSVIFNSCENTDALDRNVSVVNGDDGEKTQFDLYLDREYVDPYNISFLYKLPDIETNFNHTLVPATLENSIKMSNLVKYLCLEPYDAVAPEFFMKKFFPKQLLMVGSAAYQNNGTRIIGTAEGGLKISLFEINNLDVTNIETLNALYFRTIYHEFSHILHQNVDFSSDFDAITETTYVGDSWNESWTAANPSNAAGYISNYASKEATEDFVELIAHYITSSTSTWDDIIAAAGDTGGPIITQKMELVKKYLQTTWSINIDDLRDEIQTRSANLNDQDLDNIN